MLSGRFLSLYTYTSIILLPLKFFIPLYRFSTHAHCYACWCVDTPPSDQFWYRWKSSLAWWDRWGISAWGVQDLQLLAKYKQSLYNCCFNSFSKPRSCKKKIGKKEKVGTWCDGQGTRVNPLSYGNACTYHASPPSWQELEACLAETLTFEGIEPAPFGQIRQNNKRSFGSRREIGPGNPTINLTMPATFVI